MESGCIKHGLAPMVNILDNSQGSSTIGYQLEDLNPVRNMVTWNKTHLSNLNIPIPFLILMFSSSILLRV